MHGGVGGPFIGKIKLRSPNFSGALVYTMLKGRAQVRETHLVVRFRLLPPCFRKAQTYKFELFDAVWQSPGYKRIEEARQDFWSGGVTKNPGKT